jgi:hypothetical protein
VAEVLDVEGAFIDARKIVPGFSQPVAKFYRHMGDEDAVLLPELIDLPLATIDEVVEVMDKEDAFTGSNGSAATTEQNVIGALAGRENAVELTLGHDFKAGEF